MEVLYDGKPTGNLHVVSVQITNESQTDLSNLELITELNEGSFVLRSAAQVRGSASLLGFSGGYAAILARERRSARSLSRSWTYGAGGLISWRQF